MKHNLLKNTFKRVIVILLSLICLTTQGICAVAYNVSGNLKINEVNGQQLLPGVNTVLATPFFIKDDVTKKFTINIAMLDSVTVNGIAGAKVDGVANLYVATGYRDAAGDHYLADIIDSTSLYFPMDLNPVPLITTFFTKGKKIPAPGIYTLNQSLGIVSSTDYSQAGGVYLTGTLVVTASTCAVSTNKTISINWPSLSAGDIQADIASTKTAPITVGCQGNGEGLPMDVFISSDNGSADSAGGVINTSASNLGLKLTWADGGTPVPLDKTFQIPSPASGASKDLSIVAKPVATGRGNIAAGDFNSTLTMTIQYH